MAKLTVKELEALGTDDHGRTISDEGSLVGKVRATMEKSKGGISVSFCFRYKRDNKLVELSCGTWPKNSLAQIRAARDAAKGKLVQGIDPQSERKISKLKARVDQEAALNFEKARLQAIVTQKARMTVADLFEHWATIDLVRRKDGGKEIRRMFNKDVLPKIGEIAAEDVKKGQIIALIDILLARGVKRMAKVVFSLIRQMFRFAQDREIVEADPTAGIRKAKIGGKDTERDRVLSDEEIRELHDQLPNARLRPSTEIALWLCLSTCCRIGELLRAKWNEVDFEKRVWKIPAENSKNGKPHTVYLSDFAFEQFKKLYTLKGVIEATSEYDSRSQWCYPDRTGKRAVCVKTITKQLGDRQRDKDRLSNRSRAITSLKLSGGLWTPHDLRRTGATLMAALGVIPEVAERCLNHIEQNKIKRIYQRHSYEKEMQEAWQLLGNHLAWLSCGSNNVIIGHFAKVC